MKAFLKRYSLAICALLCVLALAGVWVGIRLSADAGTYRLDDVEGDRSYLKNVNISMKLYDAAHVQQIALNSGQIRHRYEYTSPLSRTYSPSINAYQKFVEDKSAETHVMTDRQMETSGDDYELWVTRLTRVADKASISLSVEQNDYLSSNPQTYLAQVVTDVMVQSKGQPFFFNLQKETSVFKNQFSEQGNKLPDVTSDAPFSYVSTDMYSDETNETGEANKAYEAETGYNKSLLANAEDGTYYFTPALRPYHSGTSAIYRIDKWGSYGYTEEPTMTDGYLCYSDPNTRSVGTITKLVSFPVDGHQMQTVSLDVVNNRLCLLLVEDGVLTLRVYSMDGGLQYEIALFEADSAQTLSSILDSNQSGGDTMLCYRLQGVSYNEDGLPIGSGESKLFCIRLGEKAELMSVLTGRDAIWRAAYIGGNWVLAEAEPKETLSLYGLNISDHMQNCISVLNSTGKTLYKGRLITDETEDRTQYYLLSDNSDYAGNIFIMNRSFEVDDISEG